KHVKPAGPTVECTALDNQSVEEHEDGRRPSQQAYAVRPPQLCPRRSKDVVSFKRRVFLLVGEPARKRLPIVKVDWRPQRYDCASDLDAVSMYFVAVLRFVFPIEDGSGRIKRRSQVAAVHAMDERRAKSSAVFSWCKLLDLARQRFADY